METKTNNWLLWVGLAIPVVVLLVVFFITLVPARFDTKYDLLYYFQNDYNYNYCYNRDVFIVKDNKLSVTGTVRTDNENCKQVSDRDLPKIYRYNINADQSSLVSLEDAKKLFIDSNTLSPDGMSTNNGRYYDSGIFEIFGGSNNYNSIYLQNSDGDLKKVELGNNHSRYDFAFIGWVLK